jgi:hypothetical protein
MSVEQHPIPELFNTLRQALAREISSAQWSEVQHFLDHDEYGLALEVLVDVVVEDRVSIPESAIEMVAKLALAMECPSEKIIERLRHDNAD